MSQEIRLSHNDIHIVLEITDEKDVRLLHFSPNPYAETMHKDAEQRKRSRLVEVQVSGENQDDHHGIKHTRTNPGFLLEYVEHRDFVNSTGRKIEIMLEKDGLYVTCHMQFMGDLPVVRSWTEVKNASKENKGLEYVSSFALSGIEKEGLKPYPGKCNIYIPHNTWYGEGQWRRYTPGELGLNPVNFNTLKRIQVSSRGTWSTYEYLPMGCFENTECGTMLFWQIEHNGSWSWEIADQAGLLYLQLSGPSETESAWYKELKPGDTFVSVPAAVGIVQGGFDEAMAALIQYRRLIRRPNEDNVKLPVIFNDYANCLNGDPTTEKLLPLIDAAAEAGCEYFCIDAGWYSDGEWWDGVGEWLPAPGRFPGGIKEPLDYIRSKGMIPGLWLELEVMGINCPLAKKVPDDWFFKRHGRPVMDHGRYQLDFRNKEVRDHADRVIDRLVKEYGVGYIKMDYNINGGLGTEVNADSFGDGLLEHNRAYLSWLDSVFSRYPDLVIENCGSGGMRMDYAQLSRHSIQSVTDQSDYRQMALIAAAAPSAATPEQCAIWSYPSMAGDAEEVVFNMVNAMLMRIHQSGHLAYLPEENLALVHEGIGYYKRIRQDIPRSLPFWPLGTPTYGDGWTALGLMCGDKAYLAVWRLNGPESVVELPIGHFKGKDMKAYCAYPAGKAAGLKGQANFIWNKASGSFSVELPAMYTARIFELVVE